MNKIQDNVTILKRNSAEISFLYSADNKLAKAIDLVGDLTYKLHLDPYIFLIETIISQMLSNKVAAILIQRMHQLSDTPLSPEIVSRITTEEFRAIGLSNQKAGYIQLLTKSVTSNQLKFSAFINQSDDEIIKQLTALRGIGNWSAKMYLIFHLNRPNVIPYEDGAFIQAFSWLYNINRPQKREIENIAKNWSPHASIAARYLYKLLDNGYTDLSFEKLP